MAVSFKYAIEGNSVILFRRNCITVMSVERFERCKEGGEEITLDEMRQIMDSRQKIVQTVQFASTGVTDFNKEAMQSPG